LNLVQFWGVNICFDLYGSEAVNRRHRRERSMPESHQQVGYDAHALALYHILNYMTSILWKVEGFSF